MNFAALTIVSLNYIPYAHTLGESFKKHHHQDFFILIVDKKQEFQQNSNYKYIWVEDLGIENFISYAYIYNILELNTNVKPSALKYLFKNGNYDACFYIDPDIKFFQTITPIADKFKEFDIILTPHAITPYKDNLSPSDLTILKSGIYNLGFIGVKNTLNGLNLLNWWEQKCLEEGFNDPDDGIFVDQKWMNFTPAYFDKVLIYKEPDINVAYWNLHEREITKKNSTFYVNQSQLIFFHFSGFKYNAPKTLSKYQNRHHLGISAELDELFNDYKNDLVKNEIQKFSSYQYGFNRNNYDEEITSTARSIFYNVYLEKLNINPFELRIRDLKNNSMSLQSNLLPASQEKYKTFARIISHGLRFLNIILGDSKFNDLILFLRRTSTQRNLGKIFFRN